MKPGLSEPATPALNSWTVTSIQGKGDNSARNCLRFATTADNLASFKKPPMRPPISFPEET